MKYFSLIFILFFSLSSFARDCPVDRPLQDTNGNCYSCNDERTFIHISEDVGGEEFGKGSIRYNGGCKDLCPNRLSYSDGWLEAPEYCVLDTFENRIMAHLINNIMYIMFNPLNWLNFFIVWFILSQSLLWIFKKHKATAVRNIIKIFSILPSIVFVFYFLNNLIITLVGGLFFIVSKFQKKKQKTK